MSVLGPARGLLLASHPGPALVVTGVVIALAAAAGASAAESARVALVVLVGQLSVGWSNDAVDAGLDAAAGRTEKAVVRGLVEPRLLWLAASAALGLALVLSVPLLGGYAGSAHVAAVLAAWAYNLWLKDTAWSAVPYAVAFGLVPVVAAGAAQGRPPEPWTMLAGAALGVAAHLANTAGDVPSDIAVGRGGLAVRLGARRARLAAVASFTLGSVLVLLALPVAPLAAVTVGSAQVLVLVVAVTRAEGRGLFPAVLAVVASDAVLVATVGLAWL